MYEIKTGSTAPDNFYRGFFPAVPDHGTVKSGATIRAHAPVVLGADGLEEATAATLDKLVGISADASDGDEVVYYQTGDFNPDALVMAADVTLELLKPACRKLCIFLTR